MMSKKYGIPLKIPKACKDCTRYSTSGLGTPFCAVYGQALMDANKCKLYENPKAIRE